VDIAEWLHGLGLGQYSPAFAENAVDWDVLPKLTAEDLREIGVAAVGDRRRLLDAIGRIGTTAISPAPAEAAASGSAERRQLTVMFCDLVGSTALATRFDPEDLRELIGAYHRAVAETVSRFAGFVAKYMGDGVLVYFGYPQAHEDDAERAVRTGLTLLEVVARLPAPEALQAHIGTATGLVVVGDLIGDGAAQERGVVGETPNLAARLEGLAPPGTLVIDEATKRQLGRLFELEDLGLQPLGGLARPQQAWRVLGESGAISRFEALRSGETRLVGRDEELALLLRRWRQAKSGEGRVVLVSGEPGIGKSRLSAAIHEAVAHEPHTRMRWFCSPHHQDSALHPTIVQIERAAGFVRDDSPADRLAKLRDLLIDERDDELELIAEMLSLPNNAAALNLSAPRKREMLFEALLRQFALLAQQQPVLAIFEDAHWIDPTSREVLDLMVDRVRRLPILLIVTFRPEFQPPWGGQSHVTTLALNRLDGREVGALVLGVAGNAPLGDEVVQEIVERTDGVPLFVEELTKAVLERTAGEDRIAAVLSAKPVSALAVPATLHASLMSRLDRIGVAAKEVAQVGSVLGREFSYDLIERVAQRTEMDLCAALEQLTDAGLLFCRGNPPHASYIFKHALVQDAAYGTLLRARRLELHARVAAVLEQRFSELAQRRPELLAHHLSAGGQSERAVVEWLRAGRHAAARLAHREALRHFERGLGELAGLMETADRDTQEIDLQLARGLSLFTTEGFNSAGAAEAYARARQLAERQADYRREFMSVYGLWQSANGAGRMRDCRAHANRLQQLTSTHPDEDLRLQAHHSAWTTCLFSGDPAAADEHCGAGRSLYDIERHREHRYLYGGHDPGVCARYMGAQAKWLLGLVEEASSLGRQSLDLAERIAHPFTRGTALVMNSMLQLDMGASETALRYLEEAEALGAAQRIGFAIEPDVLRAAVVASQGELVEAVARLRAGLAKPRPVRLRPYALARLSEALSLLADHAAALDAAREGFIDQERTGQRRWEAELRRFEAMALWGLNQLDQAEYCLKEALRVARQQQAKPYELRAATSLARLMGDQGRREAARELVAPVYAWFTEGFDSTDLKDARRLLDELA
jgi:class 3 adenylate cyclase/tetratricopeptide (TPR) repeat protein